MQLTVNTQGLHQAVARLQDLPRQLRFAAVLAITRTAKRVADAEVDEMRDVFDRPTPFTLRSVFVKGARPETPFAEVGIKNDSGGQRPAPLLPLLAVARAAAAAVARAARKQRGSRLGTGVHTCGAWAWQVRHDSTGQGRHDSSSRCTLHGS